MHDKWEVEEALKKIGFDTHRGVTIYFSVDSEDGWEDEDYDYGGFHIMATLDPSDWDASEPDWEIIDPIINKIGLVPEWGRGWSSESTVTFMREDQGEEIQKMEWDDLRDLIIKTFTESGCKLVNY